MKNDRKEFEMKIKVYDTNMLNSTCVVFQHLDVYFAIFFA